MKKNIKKVIIFIFIFILIIFCFSLSINLSFKNYETFKEETEKRKISFLNDIENTDKKNNIKNSLCKYKDNINYIYNNETSVSAKNINYNSFINDLEKEMLYRLNLKINKTHYTYNNDSKIDVILRKTSRDYCIIFITDKEYLILGDVKDENYLNNQYYQLFRNKQNIKNNKSIHNIGNFTIKEYTRGGKITATINNGNITKLISSDIFYMKTENNMLSILIAQITVSLIISIILMVFTLKIFFQ